ncbi:MAG: hypothetical protein ACRDTH_01105 [Pseudonocardiaceae bacterium]
MTRRSRGRELHVLEVRQADAVADNPGCLGEGEVALAQQFPDADAVEVPFPQRQPRYLDA